MEGVNQNHKSMIARMTAAGVPRGAWTVSLSQTGRQGYLDFAQAALDKDARREVATCRYLYCGNANQALEEAELSARACAQTFKTQATMYTTFHELYRLLRLPPAEEQGLHDKVHGRGAIIVANLPTIKWLKSNDHIHSACAEVFSWLQSHAYHGGVLIVAGTARVSTSYRSGYSADFERLFVESGEIVEVPAHVSRT